MNFITMGNSHSSHQHEGSEMFSSSELGGRQAENLCEMGELLEDCANLKSAVQRLARAVDGIFMNEEAEESTTTMEQRLLAMTHSNQTLVQKLTRNLEQHAKLVNRGQERNEELIKLVKDLVATVNSYMTMLIFNIRKLKRLLSEIKPYSDEGGRWTKRSSSGRLENNLIYDVIADQQDVDAMLLQLLETEKQREELERTIVMVLVLWKDYRYLNQVLEQHDDTLDEVDSNVRHMSANVCQNLAQLYSKQSFK
ncbi:uncharacterized protein LOC131941604 [Physella acuta]|uniref:uncharacterized protein LOC131941604 n=1 Tax=Physella acuta TaxID=109671 RepID=UPI0027DB5E87|nr:uncharacterized protein LOC131941604 [Physella acuta]XP_059156907.1 uncharacterized protein LOC131941604 [Physella acuta]XP_059156909.1 uncharacterized protein LOC131941604 [Physella acuta]XP_059156910.1 uncharacterized protein LOC131941604 [Physella acuta]XP_059156911.1 uncharacterized protein LOC131941604 [Physella acuta]XP_059156912.1 uncharacterized protein LOC131941604 [Physella acuta]